MNLEQKRFIEKIEGVEVSERYTMRVSEICAIYDTYILTNRIYEGLMYAFNYGFKRGVNYGRKQTKC